MVSMKGLLFGLGSFAVVSTPGLGILYLGYVWRRIQRQIRELETVDVASATPGVVKVTGEAKPVDGVGTVAPPLSGTDCLAYEFEIQGYRPSDGSNWHDIEKQSERRRLHVEDATGTAVVDPADFDMYFEDHTVTVENRNDAPQEVLAFLQEYEYGDKVLGWRKAKFIERRLEPGEQALVVGHATRETSVDPVRGPSIRIRKGDISGLKKWLGQPLVLSDKSESEVLEQQKGWAMAAFLFGVFWLFLSLFFAAPFILGSL